MVKVARLRQQCAAARASLGELAKGEDRYLCIKVRDKRERDLLKVALYSEAAKIREDRMPDFQATTIAHKARNSKAFEVYFEKRK